MLSERVDLSSLVELARKGDSQAFRLSAADLARLSACIVRTDRVQTDGVRTDGGRNAAEQDGAELAAGVRFDIGPDGFPRVGFSVTGSLRLECQRCLEPVAWPVRIETCLTVLESDEQTALLASPLDSVVTDVDGLDLIEVIEDEILAALPMVPVHRDESACRQASRSFIDRDSDSVIEAESMHRPFADLASLVGSRKSDVEDKS
jgi:uncharacterized protein